MSCTLEKASDSGTNDLTISDHSTYAPDSNHLVGSDKEGAPDPHDKTLHGLLVISRGTSIILLVVYCVYLFFQVSTLDHAITIDQRLTLDVAAQIARFPV